MAVFQYDNLLLPYEFRLSPFKFDLVLLQGSRFNADYWQPLLEHWEGRAVEGGRILTCDWTSGSPEYFHRFFQTLGMQRLRVVACDDAVSVVRALEADFPGVVEKSLLFEKSAPRGAELITAVEDFLN